jgi:hypothetical protein
MVISAQDVAIVHPARDVNVKERNMNGQHWLTLGIGVLIGWLVLPLVLGMFTGKGA